MKTLLRGGFVVSGRGCRRADVLIDGEKIEKVGHIPPELAAQSELVDVTGCMLFPGFIDAHTHFDLDVCNTTTADDFESGSKSAIRGGTTTVIDFACPNKGESLAYGLDLWHKNNPSIRVPLYQPFPPNTFSYSFEFKDWIKNSNLFTEIKILCLKT